MTHPAPSQCTAKDPRTDDECAEPSELYLCQSHTLELEELIQEAGFLWTCLDPVLQATKNTRPANQGHGGGGDQWTPPVPDAAVGLDRDGIRGWLRTYTGYDAFDVAAHHTDAGQFLAHARYMVHRARPLVHGPKAQEPTSQGYVHASLKLAQCEPMTSRDLRCWFAKHGIHIKAKQIKNWVQYGHIQGHRDDPANLKELPKYEPTQVYFAYLNHNDGPRIDRRRNP